MGKWLDLARGIDGCAVSAVSADSPPNCTNSTNCNDDTPRVVVMGLKRLEAMRAPRWAGPDRWRVFVGDVRWLCDTGMVAAALGQGWSLVDLFGVSGDEQWQCLAAWIGGRRDEHGRACYLLTEIRGDRTLPYAVHVRDGGHSWHYCDTAPADARLAWSI